MSFRAREVDGLARTLVPHPFVPKDPATLAARCWETFEIQTNALATRLASLPGQHKLVLGLSGGLDSTHAALVAANALDLLGRPRSDLVCVTMPGFGSSSETQDNAEVLAGALSASFQRIGIAELSRAVLSAVGHPSSADTVEALLAQVRKDPALADVSFENVQARLRTLVLMTIANRVHGIVVGTGDLSEKALGWSTYAGDQIHVRRQRWVPKTLIQFLIAGSRTSGSVPGRAAIRRRCGRVLFAILDPPSSPAAAPPTAGKIAQPPRTPWDLRAARLLPFTSCARPSPRAHLALAQHVFQSATTSHLRRCAHALSQALLRQPVQALVYARRAQGRDRRLVAAGRLAHALDAQVAWAGDLEQR